MPNYRMLPPAVVAGQPVTSQQSMQVNGRTYSGVPGSVLDVPDMDGAVYRADKHHHPPVRPAGFLSPRRL
jgi:hypothetical protein